MERELDRPNDDAAVRPTDFARPHHRFGSARGSRFRRTRRRSPRLRASGRRRQLPFSGVDGRRAMMRIRKHPQRGTILLTVLWTIALMAALAMAAAVSFRGFAGIAAVGRDRVQGDALLTAGLEMAAGAVSSLGDTPLTERGITVDLSTRSVRARLNDARGGLCVGRTPGG